MRLCQLKHLGREIQLLKERIRKIKNRTVVDVVVGSDVDHPYIAHNITISGIDELERKLTRRLNQLIKSQGRMLDFISSIDDSEMRQILMLRYVEGLTWQQVARKMGRAGDGSTERKKHNRFLKVSRGS